MRCTILFFLICTTWTLRARQNIPFDSLNWEMGDGSFIEEYQGYQCLNAARSSILKDFVFRNGIIEYDMIIENERGFPGVQFRRDGAGNAELFYIRPHQSGNPDAMQYTPVFNGLTGWQFYHGDGFSAAKKYHYDEWFHVKIVASGDKGEVYIEDMARPVLVINKLKNGDKEGKISFGGPARYANLMITKTDDPPLNGNFKTLQTAGPEVVSTYAVSAPFSLDTLRTTMTLPERIKKLPTGIMSTEHDGLANVSRITPFSRDKNGVLATFRIDASRRMVKKMDFGFSDHVIVYLNDQPIFAGTDPFLSRDYRFLGTVGYFDTVFLNLRKGVNTVSFAIGENFGGWGVRAKLENLEGIQLLNPE